MKRAGKINKMSSRHGGRDWRRDPYGRLCTWHAPCCNWFPWDDRLSISVIMGTCGAFFPKGTWKRDDRFFADNSRWTLIGQQASEHHALAQWIINKGLIYSAWKMHMADVWIWCMIHTGDEFNYEGVFLFFWPPLSAGNSQERWCLYRIYIDA